MVVVGWTGKYDEVNEEDEARENDGNDEEGSGVTWGDARVACGCCMRA